MAGLRPRNKIDLIFPRTNMELPAEIYDMIADNIDHAPTWLNMICVSRYMYDVIGIRGRIRARTRMCGQSISVHKCEHSPSCQRRYAEIGGSRLVKRASGLDDAAAMDAIIVISDRVDCSCFTPTACRQCHYIFCDCCEVVGCEICYEYTDSVERPCPKCNFLVAFAGFHIDSMCYACLKTAHAKGAVGYCVRCKRIVENDTDCLRTDSDSDGEFSEHNIDARPETMTRILCALFPKRRDIIIRAFSKSLE